MVNPIIPSGGTGSLLPTPPDDSGGPNFLLFPDTQSNSSPNTPDDIFTPVLPMPEFTIIGFARAVTDPTSAFGTLLWKSEQDRATALSGIFRSFALAASIMVDSSNFALEVGKLNYQIYNDVTDDLVPLNTAIDDLNTADRSAETTMNTAVTTYNTALSTFLTQTQTYQAAVTAFNNHQITQAQLDTAQATYVSQISVYEDARDAYETAAGNYNDYIDDDRDTSDVEDETDNFNDLVPDINTRIDAANTKTSGTSIPQLTYQTTFTGTAPTMNTITETAPSFPTFATAVPLTSMAAAKNTIDPPISSPLSYADQIVGPAMDIDSLNSSITGTFLQAYKRYNRYLQSDTLTGVPTLPTAFLARIPDVFIGGSSGTVGAGSGISLGTIISSLSNPMLTKILDNSSFSSTIASFGDPLDPTIAYGVEIANAAFLNVFSDFIALGYIAHSVPGNTALNALDFTNGILSSISQGVNTQSTLNYLSTAFPNVPAENLKDLANALASASNLLFLEVTASQVSQALGIPQLFGEILATLQLANPDVLTQGYNLSDILSNTLSVGYLKNTLYTELQAQDTTLSSEQAQQVINQAVNNALQNHDITTVEELKNAIHSQLIASGINENTAANLASLASNYTQAEVQGRLLLDAAVNSDTVKSTNLTNSLVAQGVSQDVAEKAVKESFTSGEQISNRTLRDRIAHHLTQAGVSESTAYSAATSAVIGPAPSTASTLSLSDLRTQITDRAFNVFSQNYNEATAHNLANQLATSLVGSEHAGSNEVSLRNVLNTQLKNLYGLQDNDVSNAIDNNLRSVNLPNLDLYTFTTTYLLDPGHQAYHSAATGVMYAGTGSHFPTNFQHPNDILV